MPFYIVWALYSLFENNKTAQNSQKIMPNNLFVNFYNKLNEKKK